MTEEEEKINNLMKKYLTSSFKGLSQESYDNLDSEEFHTLNFALFCIKETSQHYEKKISDLKKNLSSLQMQFERLYNLKEDLKKKFFEIAKKSFEENLEEFPDCRRTVELYERFIKKLEKAFDSQENKK